MKKIVALLMVLLFLFSCTIVSAETPRYKTTQSFLNALTDTKYTLTVASDDDKYDCISIGFNDSDFEFNLFFDSTNHVHFRLWSTKKVTAGKNYALDIVNQLNNTYKWAKFLLDANDNTISINWDAMVPDECDEIVMEMYLRLLVEVNDDEILAMLATLY